MEESNATLTLVLALAAGVVAQSLARHLRIPGIVLLLLVGTLLGPDGLSWVEPRSMGEGLPALVDLAVAVILFEGGLNLEISRLRREQAPIRRLVTWGALVTLLGGTLAARLLLDWGWEAALLFGSLVVVTGPTVVGPLVSELRLKPRVATVLNAEGVLIDPVGAILAVLVLELVLAPDAGVMASGARDLVFRLGFGAGMGAIGGYLLARLLRVRELLPEGLENIFSLAAVLVLFAGCDEVVSHSGILAVTVAGVVVGNMHTPVTRDLREFKDQLTVLLVGLLFVMLAADVRLADVQALGWAGVSVVAALVLIVRPAGVWLSTLGSDLPWGERALIAWIAPRGIVAAAIASLVAASMEEQGISGSTELRALVFLTIACTVLLAGLTSAPIARWLGTRLPGRDVIAILGAEGVGLALARELRAAEQQVVFLDSNPQTCREAEEQGFNVIFGNAMEERTLLRARFESVGSAIALTPNQTVNSAFVARARQLFRVPKNYVGVARLESGLASELVKEGEAKVIFEGAHDLERWNVRFRHGAAKIEHWRVERPAQEEVEGKEEKAAAIDTYQVGERLICLTVTRGKRCQPMSMDLELQPGDEVAIAVHEPDREGAHELLAGLGWEPLPEDEVDSEPADGGAAK